MHRLLSVLLQPGRDRDVEDDRIALGIQMDHLRHQMSTQPVSVTARPVHHEPLPSFLLRAGWQRQDTADGAAAGRMEDVRGEVLSEHIQRRQHEPGHPVGMRARTASAHPGGGAPGHVEGLDSA